MIFQKIYQFKKGKYKFLRIHSKKLNGKVTQKFPNLELDKFIDLIKDPPKPIFYTGGGVINSGPDASKYLRELVSVDWFFNNFNTTKDLELTQGMIHNFRNARHAWNLRS